MFPSKHYFLSLEKADARLNRRTPFFSAIRINILLCSRKAVLASFEETRRRSSKCDEKTNVASTARRPVIGEKGYRLSGGQRQRIAMARSLIRDPDIFVLDEATSNLDSHSERLIQDAFSHIRQDHTMLVVAHRLSTVKQADYILVLDHGRLAEEGTHEVLLEKNGIYAHLWYLQSGTISPTDSFTDR